MQDHLALAAETDRPSIDALLPFADVVGMIPRRRGGRKVHLSTLHRWATAGVKGVKLRYWNLGGTRATTESALMDFFEAISSRDDDSAAGSIDAPPPKSPRPTASRRQSIERAEQALVAAGI